MRRVRPDAEIWQQPEMLEALAFRDIAQVYRILQKHGVSQRHIAALTGQSQSEISEILNGRRVYSYDVLVRIADGLGVPRGHLGLAHGATTEPLVGPLPPRRDPVSGHWVVRLPVLVGTYGAAMSLLESFTAPVLSPKAAKWKERSDAALTDRSWLKQARATLTRLR